MARRYSKLTAAELAARDSAVAKPVRTPVAAFPSSLPAARAWLAERVGIDHDFERVLGLAMAEAHEAHGGASPTFDPDNAVYVARRREQRKAFCEEFERLERIITRLDRLAAERTVFRGRKLEVDWRTQAKLTEAATAWGGVTYRSVGLVTGRAVTNDRRPTMPQFKNEELFEQVVSPPFELKGAALAYVCLARLERAAASATDAVAAWLEGIEPAKRGAPPKAQATAASTARVVLVFQRLIEHSGATPRRPQPEEALITAIACGEERAPRPARREIEIKKWKARLRRGGTKTL